MDRGTYIWNLDPSSDARRAHAKRLRGLGLTRVQVKAGGDDGRLWPEWVDPAATREYREEGLTVEPWFYTWPTEADRLVVKRAFDAQPFERYALNPETEWRTDSQENPWNTVAQANEGAFEWLLQMDLAMPSMERWFSSVPSWTGFPYEAWCQGCDLAQPQHYWPRNLLADVYGHDYDEVGYHRLRGGDTLPCIPIITACREYPDAGVVALAATALHDFPNLDGFSFWEAGNGAFQWDAAQKCLDLLPATIEISTGPKDEYVRSWVDQRGVPTTQIIWGGQATKILSTTYNDVGIRMEGVPATNIYHRSIFNGVFQPYVLE
jgi:hypothetical protein